MIINLKKKDSVKQLCTRPSIRAFEISCKDGSPTAKYNTRLNIFLKRAYSILERQYGYKDIIIMITSGYRTKSHNSSIGGASNSQHLTGSALDHSLSGIIKGKRTIISTDLLAKIYQICDTPGIEIINDKYIHIDCRKHGTFRSVQKSYRRYSNVSSFVNESNRFSIVYNNKKYKIYGYKVRPVPKGKVRIKINRKLKWVKGGTMKYE